MTSWLAFWPHGMHYFRLERWIVVESDQCLWNEVSDNFIVIRWALAANDVANEGLWVCGWFRVCRKVRRVQWSRLLDEKIIMSNHGYKRGYPRTPPREWEIVRKKGGSPTDPHEMVSQVSHLTLQPILFHWLLCLFHPTIFSSSISLSSEIIPWNSILISTFEKGFNILQNPSILYGEGMKIYTIAEWITFLRRNFFPCSSRFQWILYIQFFTKNILYICLEMLNFCLDGISL